MPKIALPVALTARYNAELYYLWFLIFALYERKNEEQKRTSTLLPNILSLPALRLP
jgi:hypothetical protein